MKNIVKNNLFQLVGQTANQPHLSQLGGQSRYNKSRVLIEVCELAAWFGHQPLGEMVARKKDRGPPVIFNSGFLMKHHEYQY